MLISFFPNFYFWSSQVDATVMLQEEAFKLKANRSLSAYHSALGSGQEAAAGGCILPERAPYTYLYPLTLSPGIIIITLMMAFFFLMLVYTIGRWDVLITLTIFCLIPNGLHTSLVLPFTFHAAPSPELKSSELSGTHW